MSDYRPLDDGMSDLREIVQNAVAAGFLDDEEVVESAVEALEDEYDPAQLRAAAGRIAADAVRRHREAQAGWPAVTDCDRLDAAFDELERRGIVARQNFSCCTNCGSREIWDEVDDALEGGVEVRGCTFYHAQDLERAAGGGGLYLAFAAVEEGDPAAAAIGREIAETLGRHGLAVEWDGSRRTRLSVPLDWKRRRPAAR